MPNFTYNANIPAASDNPSTSQGQMQTNCNSVASLVSVDLYGFNDNNGGTHQQVTFPANTTPGAPASGAVIYPTAGTADPTRTQIFWRNTALTFALSSLRAYACVTPSTATILQSFNVASFTRNSAGNYTVVLSANATSTTSYGVLISCDRIGTDPVVVNYTISTATNFTIASVRIIAGGTLQANDPPKMTFCVYQI